MRSTEGREAECGVLFRFGARFAEKSARSVLARRGSPAFVVGGDERGHRENVAALEMVGSLGKTPQNIEMANSGQIDGVGQKDYITEKWAGTGRGYGAEYSLA